MLNDARECLILAFQSQPCGQAIAKEQDGFGSNGSRCRCVGWLIAGRCGVFRPCGVAACQCNPKSEYRKRRPNPPHVTSLQQRPPALQAPSVSIAPQYRLSV